MRALVVRFIEGAPYADGLVEEWDAGARDATACAGPFVWAICEADDVVAGAHAWVDDLARTLRGSGAKVTVVW